MLLNQKLLERRLARSGRLCFLGLVCWMMAPIALAQSNYVNWENHPTHALDLSPDEQTLALAHTADASLLWFDVTSATAVLKGKVRVGLDPVSVRYRTATEVWVVNHISDSISVVDIATRESLRTIKTCNEPSDVVFAGDPVRAYVSCTQADLVQVFTASGGLVTDLPLAFEEPRALAVSTDGREVYVASFRSGNRSTILAGATAVGNEPPNVTRLLETPYGGQVPAPNSGTGFSPMLNPSLPAAPLSGLIVRQAADGRWLDDNDGDWTPWVSGSSAVQSGRVTGWSMPDHDVAIIDTSNNSVSYVSDLLNIGMALAVHPVSGQLLLVGTQATNEVRFEPNLQGTFVRVQAAMIDPDSTSSPTIFDLNPQLDYLAPRVDSDQRRQSVGDPRSVVWAADGQRGFASGMGSNNVIVIDANGSRASAINPIDVGEGPTGLALDSARGRLYVWNHFAASLSVVDTEQLSEIDQVSLFSPAPDTIRIGRAHLYNTHQGSGLGQAACASCHVDARADRLAWDLGSPAGEMEPFTQNCISDEVGRRCRDFHPLKGPMTTQTLQDIINHEPFHWRGDRSSLSDFNANFESLQGADSGLSDQLTAELKAYLATIHLPPNPFRRLDNQLPTSLDTGEVSAGRFSPIGAGLPLGNAQLGLVNFRTGLLAGLPAFLGITDNCVTCHSLPTGMSVNGAVLGTGAGRIGGRNIPPGPLGEQHLGVSSMGTVTNATFKVPQLRNLYERVGMRTDVVESRSGFGFTHDGSVDTLSRFLSLGEFEVGSDQEIADVAAFLLAFSGSDLPTTTPNYVVPVPTSQDSHAAIGQQFAGADSMLDLLINEASQDRLDLYAHCNGIGWLFDRAQSRFLDSAGAAATTANLRADNTCSFTAAPTGMGARLAHDQDSDGVADAAELAQGSDPTDPSSNTLRPWAGLWWNPARAGHGVDVQLVGDTLAATWYTYQDDGSAVWYQAAGPLQGDAWQADLLRFELDRSMGQVVDTTVGTASFTFTDRATATWSWTLDGVSGSEPFERFAFDSEFRVGNYTGLWYDPSDSGWGLSIDALGNTRVVVIYFYDANDQPRWALGAASNAASGATAMDTFTGFCPSCDAVATTAVSAGTIDLGFLSTRVAQSQVDVSFGADPWQRNTELIPLTSPVPDLSPYQ